MPRINRRSFLKNTAFTAAAVGWSARSWSQVAGANSDIRVAVLGLHGRGGNHIDALRKIAGVRITALCDPDSDLLAGKAKNLAGVATYTDIRKLLESKEVDAVTLATPNHWHALGAIWAAQAGKDVYVEKPVSHNIWEGRKIVEAARKYQKIIQAGTQSRSSLTGIKAAVEWVRAGNLGKIKLVRGLCYKRRDSIGKTTGPQAVPANIDYDLWCGPAAKTPPRRNSEKNGPVHYEWHWFWEYGGGDVGNQGIHEMDVARWFHGATEPSPRVLSVGGRLGYVDDAETPNTQLIYHDYADAPLIFEVRGLPEKSGAKDMDRLKGVSIGIVVECEGGYVTVGDYVSATAFDKEGKEVKRFAGTEDHFANWINAVRSRKVEDLHCDILDGHISSMLCHTGNISYRLGGTRPAEEIKAGLKADAGMTEAYGRMAAHLAANGVDMEKDKVTLGVPLNFDPKGERFTGNDAANKLITREYRAPFVVPEKV